MEDPRFLRRQPSFECHQHHNIPLFDFFVILRMAKFRLLCMSGFGVYDQNRWPVCPNYICDQWRTERSVYWD
ncbi:unnamed protein product [Linum tenue]|uniref:Uncharacterized protein n=1 Tax=Linum tenue TaxID=586396 RepID=A0AAV0QAH5_9ROSI|nr:unnamed protein product [Linum tenue]